MPDEAGPEHDLRSSRVRGTLDFDYDDDPDDVELPPSLLPPPVAESDEPD